MSHTHKPYGQYSGAVRYAECLKNHATAVGGAATDGCREFMAGGPEGTIEALKCAACDCHRNFHRKIRLHVVVGPAAGGGGRPEKRMRTKFSGEQKEKMLVFAERAGWRLSWVDDGEVRRFCEEIGVSRKVLRVWVHNNKYRSVKKNKNTSCS